VTGKQKIQLVETDSETTLLIDGDQAMQAWERDLMWASADLLSRHGDTFYEVGLGLGISALRVAANPATRSHTVLELHPEVIDLFRERNPSPPASLHIEQGDLFERFDSLPAEAFDGILFDPALDIPVWDDPAVWERLVPRMVRTLRPGGVFIPFFSTRPELRWQYLPYFRHIIVERHPYRAYEHTTYTHGVVEGDAYLQCFRKDADG
jgi:SAM-dependent methyltransferase